LIVLGYRGWYAARIRIENERVKSEARKHDPP
jgi:hypothetical protein